MDKPKFCYKCDEPLTFCECEKPITDKEEHYNYLKQKLAILEQYKECIKDYLKKQKN